MTLASNQNPIPSIQRISPTGAMAGSPAFSLKVFGSNFMPTSVVQWNGQPRNTQYVNTNVLTADIPATDIAQPGLAGVTVFNPTPGGGTSNVVTFVIAEAGRNPPPTITRLTPEFAFSDGAASTELSLTIVGTNFVEGAVAKWNGANRPTVFIDGNMLRMTVTAGDVATEGTAAVTVVNPTPGGGESNAVTFAVLHRFPLWLPLVMR